MQPTCFIAMQISSLMLIEALVIPHFLKDNDVKEADRGKLQIICGACPVTPRRRYAMLACVDAAVHYRRKTMMTMIMY